jgi:hypothetical protein
VDPGRRRAVACAVWTMKDFDSEAQIIAGARGQKK